METVNGYELNEPNEPANWSPREFNLLSAFAGLMPVSGSRVVSAGEHYHNILTNQNGVPALSITSEGNVSAVANLSAFDVVGRNDIYTTKWHSYTPEQFGGFSTATSAFKYKEVGDLVFVKYDVSGTGNEEGTNFSLPISADESGLMPVGYAGTGEPPNVDPDLNVQARGLKIFSNNTKLVCVGFGSWGMNINKEYCGNLWYRKKMV